MNLRDGPPPACDIGVLASDPAPNTQVPGASQASRYARVTLQPQGITLDARLWVPGGAGGRGSYSLPRKGDEVLVWYPGGDRGRAVFAGGLHSFQQTWPVDVSDGEHTVQHPGGVVLRDAPGTPAHRIVHEQFLTDLASYLMALETFMQSTSTHTPTSPTVGPAAGFFQTTVGAPTSAFRAQLQALAHASSNHKVT